MRLGVANDPALLKKIASLAEKFAARELGALGKIVAATLSSRKKKGGTDLSLAVAAELEPRSSWKLPHGYAVAIGILTNTISPKAPPLKEKSGRTNVTVLLSTPGRI